MTDLKRLLQDLSDELEKRTPQQRGAFVFNEVREGDPVPSNDTESAFVFNFIRPAPTRLKRPGADPNHSPDQNPEVPAEALSERESGTQTPSEQELSAPKRPRTLRDELRDHPPKRSINAELRKRW